jgi:hypothetical protein
VDDIDDHVVLAQALGDQVGEHRVVFDDEHAKHGGHRAGNVTVTDSPPPSRGVTIHAPPCAVTTESTIASPSPAPGELALRPSPR